MTSHTEHEAIKIIREAGFITRYKGYYIIVYRQINETTWRAVSKVRSANGKITDKALKAAIAA